MPSALTEMMCISKEVIVDLQLTKKNPRQKLKRSETMYNR